MFTSRPPQTAELNSLLSLSLPLSLYLSLSISLPLLTCPSPRPSVRSTISNPIQTPGHTQACTIKSTSRFVPLRLLRVSPLAAQTEASRQTGFGSVRPIAPGLLPRTKGRKGKVCHKTSVLATFFFLTYQSLSEAPTHDDGHACVNVRFSGTFAQPIQMEREYKRVRRINRHTLFACIPPSLPLSPCLQWTSGKSSRPSRRSFF